MFVRQLIGPQAGQIIEMPYHVATACISVGTAEDVTEQEVQDAGLSATVDIVIVGADEMPKGYTTQVSDGGGYDVLDDGGVILTSEIEIPNLAAARSFAIEHANIGASHPVVSVDASPKVESDLETEESKELSIPDDWESKPPVSIYNIGKKFDPSVTNAAEGRAAILAEIARRQA